MPTIRTRKAHIIVNPLFFKNEAVLIKFEAFPGFDCASKLVYRDRPRQLDDKCDFFVIANVQINVD